MGFIAIHYVACLSCGFTLQQRLGLLWQDSSMSPYSPSNLAVNVRCNLEPSPDLRIQSQGLLFAVPKRARLRGWLVCARFPYRLECVGANRVSFCGRCQYSDKNRLFPCDLTWPAVPTALLMWDRERGDDRDASE